MINTVIIEDEKLVHQQLTSVLSQFSEVRIVAILESVNEALRYFSHSPAVDLIFSDVQLCDGLSFEIFSNAKIDVPVIFITGFDKFMLYAFETNGIDYLLKPAGYTEIEKAIEKFNRLKKHFTGIGNMQNLLTSVSSKKRSRLIVKKGIENISLKFDEIIMCYTENKVVYIIDKEEKKYLCDKTLNELEEELDPEIFFRANRQFIINLQYVKSYRPYEKVKLLVDLQMNEKKHLVIISQVTAPLFRKWFAEI